MTILYPWVTHWVNFLFSLIRRFKAVLKGHKEVVEVIIDFIERHPDWDLRTVIENHDGVSTKRVFNDDYHDESLIT